MIYRHWLPTVLLSACAALASSAQSQPEAPPASAVPLLQLPATDDGLPGQGPIRRYEWFQTLWTQRRTLWSTQVKQDQGAVVFLGDSITQGWGDLPNIFPGLKVANRGISGDTTRGVLIRLQDDVIALNPRGVVLLIGTNDLEEKAEPETIANNLTLIIGALKKFRADLPVILCEVLPSAESMRRPTAQIKKINSLYRAAIRDQPQVTLVESWALFANPKGEASADEFPDLLHPNGLGYARLAAALRPIMETVGLLPAWTDDFQVEKGFTSLFNGRDFSGWTYENNEGSLDGKTETTDRRFIVKNGRLIVTVARTERDYKKLWTGQSFPQNFVLKLEFRASPNADSGVFIREPQLQCRDYLIAGPFKALKNYRPLDWNEIVVTVKDGLAHGTCNGETLVDAFPVPPTGPIGLESDHGQIEYRRIRIQTSP